MEVGCTFYTLMVSEPVLVEQTASWDHFAEHSYDLTQPPGYKIL